MIPKVSIIIPCYNSGRFIEKALIEARRQTYTNIEVVVVDDGSSDSETARRIHANRFRIDKILHQENQGQGAARNLGIKNSDGEFILTWDADDFFEPTFISKAVEILQNNKSVRIITCYALRTENGIDGDVIKPKGGQYQDFLFDNQALGSAMFCKEDWKRVNGYDENDVIRGFEDWDFFLRLLYPNGNARVIKENLFTYMVHDSSTTRKIHHLKYDKRNYILKKNKDVYINNFEDLIDDFTYRLKESDKQANKNLKRLEFKLGRKILAPFRWLKYKVKIY